ncbi:hypothetical protein Tco_0115865 [Tanacetum coccineum]
MYATWWHHLSRHESETMTCHMGSSCQSRPGVISFILLLVELPGSDESLGDYLGRFGKETLHMTDRSNGMMTWAFISGLRPGRFFKDLIAQPLASMEDLFTQARNFIRADEANTENRLRDGRWGIAVALQKKGNNQSDWKQKVVAPKVGKEVLMIDEGWSSPHYQQNGLRLNTDISFTSDDPVPDHCSGDDPLVIKAEIGGNIIHRIYVDGGSSAEIMYEHYYAGKGSRTITTDFMIVRAPSPYNVILGRPRMRQLGAIASTIHSLIKEQECETIVVPELPGNETEKENVVINTMYPDQLVEIGTRLPTRTKQEMQRILCENKDIFAWSPFDITGIPRELAEHKLNIHPRAFPVRQKKRVLAKDQNEAVTAEVAKLVKARILKEVYFTQWVANLVMVQAINDMLSPRTILEVQSLNRKLAALDQFLATSAEKALLFFKTLKGCIEKKRFLVEPGSRRSIPNTQATFIVSSRPNRADTWRGVNTLFGGISQNRQLCTHGGKRRLAKWAIELGEHDIPYKPRSSVKGVIADFLAECPNKRTKEKDNDYTQDA